MPKADKPAEHDGGDVASGEFVSIELTTRNGSATFDVPGYVDWPGSARNAMNAGIGGNDHAWALGIFDAADATEWIRLDPTLRQVNAFFDVWREKGGLSLGEAPASSD